MDIIYLKTNAIKKKEECTSYSNNVGCTSCKDGYSLVYSTCVKYPDRCLFIQKHVGCITCKQGHFLNNFNCI